MLKAVRFAPQARRGQTLRFALLILLVGLSLRVVRLDFGDALPYLAHPDEPTQYDAAMRILRTGDLNPHFFAYPSLCLYASAAVLGLGALAMRWAGEIAGFADLGSIEVEQVGIGIVPHPGLLLLGRFLSALMGTLGIALLMLLVRELCTSGWAPLLAGLALALSPEHIRLSHYMTVDVTAASIALAALVACASALRTGSGRRLLWAAALAGLSASAKYNYGVAFAAVALTGLLLDGGARQKIARIVRAGAIFAGAFLLTSPFVLLDYPAAWAAISSEMKHYAAGDIGVAGSSTLWYLSWLWHGDPAALLLGLAGFAITMRRRPARFAPVAVFVLSFAFLIAKQRFHVPRAALPVLVLLIGGAALAIEAAVDGTRHRLGDRRALSVLLGGVLAAGILTPGLANLPELLFLRGPSARARAQAWFDHALESPAAKSALDRSSPDAVKILAEGYTVFLRPETTDVTYRKTVSDFPLVAYAQHGYDLIVLGSGIMDRFTAQPEIFERRAARYHEYFERLAVVRDFTSPRDPLQFGADDPAVHVFVLTDRGRRFVESADRAAAAAGDGSAPDRSG